MAGRTLLLAALAPAALAYSNTLPVVSWSSISTKIHDALPASLSDSIHVPTLLNDILSHPEVCEHDAILLVDQPGVHASDFRTMARDSTVAKHISSSRSSSQYPYVRAQDAFDLHTLAQSVSAQCDARLLKVSHQEAPSFIEGAKHVISMVLPDMDAHHGGRKACMKESDASFSSMLESITNKFPKHLVIYTGSAPSQRLSRRQFDSEADDEDPYASPFAELGEEAANTTAAFAPPEGGILKRYQLLTPGLITSLLVVFFVLLPVMMAGIKALLSIQSPLRLDAPKGFNAQTKKQQ
ncbi:BIG/ATPase V1 complex, subunit S1 [Schizophyllum fasciatum]